MDALKKTLAMGASSILAVTGMGGVALAATDSTETQSASDAQATAQQEGVSVDDFIVRMDKVEGEFAFTQSEVTSNDDIKKNLGEASRYLCGANPTGDGEAVSVEDWSITVQGDVENAYTATFAELSEKEELQTVVMGCSCAGNPADGRAVANAEVTGISVLKIVELAQPSAEVNTVVFSSSDGYEVALPLRYLKMRYCPLVFDVNGSPIADVMGGANQLWLGSTAASYFARDIVGITLEERETPPPSPHSDEARAAYQNLPNVGVLLGGEVR